MAYYLDLFSPQTYESFGKSDRNTSGFRKHHLSWAKKIHPDDKFICYITKISRWAGILEVLDDYFEDNTPIFYEKDDPFVIRFKVKPLVWLRKEMAIPIHEDRVWNALSFTRGHDKRSSTWTGKLRSSLTKLDDQDAKFLEGLIFSQTKDGKIYPLEEEEYRRYLTQRVRRPDREVSVSVPSELKEEAPPRESLKIQALIAKIGESMKFKIWIPKNDRSGVLREWKAKEETLLDILPLNYDEATLKTIEQIDVLWLKNRSIIRAFEVEHYTKVYSGILRMADLLALQPNMKIKMHIVAPSDRREKVFQELQRPVFSLLEIGPLSDLCTFISYDSLKDLAREKHLVHFSDSVLGDYEEIAE